MTMQNVIITPYSDRPSSDEPFDDIEIVVGTPVGGAGMMEPCRGEIDFILGSFAGERILLAPAGDGLDARIAAALRNIGLGSAAVRTLAVGAYMREKCGLPPDADAARKRSAESAFAKKVRLALRRSTGELLNERFGSALAENLGEDAHNELAQAIWSRVMLKYLSRQADPADALGDVIWRSLHECLLLLIGLTVTDEPAGRSAVAPFVELFRRGHYPVGELNDGSFLVLTG